MVRYDFWISLLPTHTEREREREGEIYREVRGEGVRETHWRSDTLTVYKEITGRDEYYHQVCSNRSSSTSKGWRFTELIS